MELWEVDIVSDLSRFKKVVNASDGIEAMNIAEEQTGFTAWAARPVPTPITASKEGNAETCNHMPGGPHKMKPEPGEIWENIHTRRKTKIIKRIFFNILHENELTGYTYTHYKTFAKHWIKIDP